VGRLARFEDDADALIATAEAAVDAARAAIRPYFRATGLSAETKSDDSPVTVADRAAERAMRAVLAARFPDYGLIGEEDGTERGDASRRWVIDPIDGTRSFLTGRFNFGTLLALLDEDRPVLGVIDQPITGERWIGAAGRPTIFRGPFGGTAGCRRCPDLALAELSCTSPQMFTPSERVRWERLAGSVRRSSFGGDCYAYGLLALGQIDVIAEADLNLWDWAALFSVIEGAGGRMTDWSGAALQPSPGITPVLAVGDPALLDAALQRLAA
jgi:myo-inositol-1(or 4)-monophosphatase